MTTDDRPCGECGNGKILHRNVKQAGTHDWTEPPAGWERVVVRPVADPDDAYGPRWFRVFIDGGPVTHLYKWSSDANERAAELRRQHAST